MCERDTMVVKGLTQLFNCAYHQQRRVKRNTKITSSTKHKRND